MWVPQDQCSNTCVLGDVVWGERVNELLVLPNKRVSTYKYRDNNLHHKCISALANFNVLVILRFFRLRSVEFIVACFVYTAQSGPQGHIQPFLSHDALWLWIEYNYVALNSNQMVTLNVWMKFILSRCYLISCSRICNCEYVTLTGFGPKFVENGLRK